MSVCLAHGMLTISVDLEPDMTRLGVNQQRALEETTTQLLVLMEKHGLPATWGVADPAVSAATERIRERRASHEIAILGDATWVGRVAGRGRFGRELTRRVAHARGAGIPLTTLVLRTVTLEEHCDLVIKQGIVAVRQPAPHEPVDASQHLVPQTLRYGLWSFAVSQRLPGGGRWLPGGGGLRRARLGIDRTIAARGLFHLMIDAPALADRGHSALGVLDRVLEHAAGRRHLGVLDIATLGAAVGKLAAQYRGTPSRSILRVA